MLIFGLFSSFLDVRMGVTISKLFTCYTETGSLTVFSKVSDTSITIKVTENSIILNNVRIFNNIIFLSENFILDDY